ncbi:MAG: alpha-glucan family phosphorylase [Spirochaetales bacterium]
MNINPFTVHPNLPDSLKPLETIAHNIWMSWNYDAVQLFTRLDYDVWIESEQNPVRTLGMVAQSRFEELAGDDSYVSAVNRVYERLEKYQSDDTWYKGNRKDAIAYFSMEYGLDLSLPIYSGGLGVLSGDHMKTASDMGLPLVGVGLLYREGYFQQYLNLDGYQQESYPENDWYNMPVDRCEDKNGDPLRISVQLADATVVAQVWQVKIGRISLYLLDTNVDENAEEFRNVTATLYGGNKENRIRQEILLGVGGIRALRALGINPAVTHMNEGHSAFLGIERIRELVSGEVASLSRHEAMQALWPTNIFTTHTPVPAGNERFGIDLIQKYFDSITAGTGFGWEEFIALGREYPNDEQEPFCMTVLALKLSAYNNGVSKLHGAISRDMWNAIWPGLNTDEVPITSITNGVHARTFLSPEMQELLDRYFGPRFYDEPENLELWDRIDRISDEELWRTHERRKDRLVAFARNRLRSQLKNRGMSGRNVAYANEVLQPGILTLCFARRFATYKRATLLFRQPERLKRLLNNPDMPVQIIFAGKAHPHDTGGKQLIKDIVHFSQQPDVRNRLVFLENYDLNIAKQMVQGSDVWLNTPRRPMEASGTSGMKAAMNGVLNCSILDGWWAEAYTPDRGWAIGNGEEYDDEEMQDEIESTLLYDLLERELVPTYYERGQDGLPREWIHRMKESMRGVGKEFSCHRMIREYAETFYLPALENYRAYSRDGYKKTKSVAEYIDRVRNGWHTMSIEEISGLDRKALRVGENLNVSARVNLGSLKPEDVDVQLVYGPISNTGGLSDPVHVSMKKSGGKKADEAPEGSIDYQAKVECTRSGRLGYSVRVVPKNNDLAHTNLPGLVTWG